MSYCDTCHRKAQHNRLHCHSCYYREKEKLSTGFYQRRICQALVDIVKALDSIGETLQDMHEGRIPAQNSPTIPHSEKLEGNKTS